VVAEFKSKSEASHYAVLHAITHKVSDEN